MFLLRQIYNGERVLWGDLRRSMFTSLSPSLSLSLSPLSLSLSVSLSLCLSLSLSLSLSVSLFLSLSLSLSLSPLSLSLSLPLSNYFIEIAKDQETKRQRAGTEKQEYIIAWE